MRLQGAVLAQIPARMLVKAWPPGSWRKAVGLPGNASKADVEHVSLWQLLNSPPSEQTSMYRLGIANWPQDAHDAHLIALATQHAITTEKAA
jgi:hypothetical protein